MATILTYQGEFHVSVPVDPWTFDYDEVNRWCNENRILRVYQMDQLWRHPVKSFGVSIVTNEVTAVKFLNEIDATAFKLRWQ